MAGRRWQEGGSRKEVAERRWQEGGSRKVVAGRWWKKVGGINGEGISFYM